MQELANFHEQLVNIYGYNLQVRAGVGHWHRELVTAHCLREHDALSDCHLRTRPSE